MTNEAVSPKPGCTCSECGKPLFPPFDAVVKRRDKTLCETCAGGSVAKPTLDKREELYAEVRELFGITEVPDRIVEQLRKYLIAHPNENLSYEALAYIVRYVRTNYGNHDYDVTWGITWILDQYKQEASEQSRKDARVFLENQKITLTNTVNKVVISRPKSQAFKSDTNMEDL